MKITALLAENKPILSFEVFPPKTESGFDSVRTATEEIAALHPAFMSVTYGAGGGTSAYTLDIAENIKARYGVPTLAHLTCVSSTHETVRERIAAIRSRGIENVMALRPRFSPGYGDLAIDAQKDIFALLDCERQIGLTLGDSLLMSPGKSVTAFAGIPRAADIQNGVTR